MTSRAIPANNSTQLVSNESLSIFNEPVKLKRKESQVAKKNYHISLEGDNIERLQWLQDRVGSGTQADVFGAALQVFEVMVKEFEDGSSFYIKRVSDQNPKPLNIFECQ